VSDDVIYAVERIQVFIEVCFQAGISYLWTEDSSSCFIPSPVIRGWNYR